MSFRDDWLIHLEQGRNFTEDWTSEDELGCCDESDERISVMQWYANVHPYLTLVLCCLGLTSNVYFLSLLSMKSFRTWVNLLLSLVAVCNTCLIVTYGVFTIHFQLVASEFCDPGRQTYGWATFGVFHAHTSVLFYGWSTGLVCYTGLQRVQKLRRRSCSKINNKFTRYYLKAIAIVFAIVLVTCFPVFVATSVEGLAQQWCPLLPAGTVFKVGSSTLVNKFPVLKPLAFWTAGVTLKAVPCIGMAAGICGLLRQLHQFEDQRVRRFKRAKRAERHRAVSLSLSLVLALFLLTQIPQCLLNIGLAIAKPPLREKLGKLGDFADMLSLLNNCISFPLYCITEKTNRLHVKKMLGLCVDRQRNIVISVTGQSSPSREYSHLLRNDQMVLNGRHRSAISASINFDAHDKRFSIVSTSIDKSIAPI